MNLKRLLWIMLALPLVVGCSGDPVTSDDDNNGGTGGNGGDKTEEKSAFTPSSVTLGIGGGTFDLTAKEDLGWSVDSKSDWITVTGSQGKTFSFSVGNNTTGKERKGVVGFVNSDKERTYVNVVQSVSEGDYVPDPDERVTISAEQGRFDVVLINAAGASGTISLKPDWITYIGNSTVGGEVRYTFEAENNSGAMRTGTIYINVKGKMYTISVTQLEKSSAPVGDGREWTQREFYHRSLYIDFTATWCNNCPRMANALEAACLQLPDKIVPLGYHCSGSDLEPSTTINVPNRLMSRFGVTSLPMGIVDMRYDVLAYKEADLITYYAVSGVQQTEDLYPCSVGIEAQSSFSGQKLTANVKLYVKSKGKYKITVMVTEDGIVARQLDGATYNNNYVHNHVARMCMTDLMGDAFTTSQDFEEKSFTFSADIPANFVKDNLNVLIYVERTFGSQAKVKVGDYASKYADYYVDNCVSVPAGTKVDLQYK